MKKLTIAVILVCGLLVVLLWMMYFLGLTYDKCSSTTSQQITIPYCEHMGYKMKINEENEPICVFDDGTNCDTDDFYLSNADNGKCIYDLKTSKCAIPDEVCGNDKVREFRKRTKCEAVYHFEECEEGLVPSERKYVLEQEHCR